ncbi:hypothetical protein [Bradyrhizobium sp.]|uniref:hypothetical protein n=1 Tax=Bradyrhizobium sp. TaxID=376 RepID=UPI0040383D76
MAVVVLTLTGGVGGTTGGGTPSDWASVGKSSLANRLTRSRGGDPATGAPDDEDTGVPDAPDEPAALDDAPDDPAEFDEAPAALDDVDVLAL